MRDRRPERWRSAGRGAPGSAAAAGGTGQADIELGRVHGPGAADSEGGAVVRGMVKDQEFSRSTRRMPEAMDGLRLPAASRRSQP